VTNEQIIQKTSCPTCGATPGKSCSQGAGRLRPEPHQDRRTTANGGMLGSIMAKVRAQMPLKNR